MPNEHHYIIVGFGSHGPFEKLAKTCCGKPVPVPSTPFEAVLPPGLTIPMDDKVQMVSFNDVDLASLHLGGHIYGFVQHGMERSQSLGRNYDEGEPETGTLDEPHEMSKRIFLKHKMDGFGSGWQLF